MYLQRKRPADDSETAIASTTSSSDTNNPPEKYDVKRRDWSSMLIDFDTDADKPKSDDTTVSADQVIENLGLKAVVPGLKDRVVKRNDVKPKSKMEEKQALEEVMGRGTHLFKVLNSPSPCIPHEVIYSSSCS